MNYPLISDYVSSILSAEDNFKELTNLRPILDDEGQPIMSSGNFAVVFKMKDEQKGKLYAVKCFLKEQEGRAKSYKLIEEELEFVSSNYLTPIRYMEGELFVDSNNTEDTEFPILLMDWVEGITLDKYIRTHIGYVYGLAMLTYRFSKLASWLLAQPFAHGDLKSDNILVKEDGSLVLVDYDGMYVPAMKGQKAREIGSPDFRHPKRTEDNFDEHIDDFAIASILLSLKAISLNPILFKLYGDSDRLLFSQKDYLDLSNSYIINAIRPLMIDDELNLLFSIFLLAHSKMELSLVSFQILNMKRPIEDVSIQKLNNDKLDLSNSEVQLDMGRRFLYGFGVPKNADETFKWFTLSAEQGNVDAIKNLGHCYRSGIGIESDYSEAVKWYLKAAEQGHAKSQNKLADHYLEGKGTSKNIGEAKKYLTYASYFNQPDSFCHIGLMMIEGIGFNKDVDKGLEYIRRSANLKCRDAYLVLGKFYEFGQYVKKDIAQATYYYSKFNEKDEWNEGL